MFRSIIEFENLSDRNHFKRNLYKIFILEALTLTPFLCRIAYDIANQFRNIIF